MRILLLTLLLLSPIITTLCADQLNFPETVKFAPVKMGQKAEVTVTGYNRSPNTITIEKTTVSCGCTAAKISNEAVPPGGHVSLDISITTNQKLGPMSKSVRVYYSGNVTPHRIIVRGTVEPLPKFEKHPEVNGISIFSKDCASGHVLPGENKYGESLYMSDCAFLSRNESTGRVRATSHYP